MTRAARNATCCEHPASDHDTHGCAVNVSTHSRTYERCHGLVTAPDARQTDELREAIAEAYAKWAEAPFEPAEWQRQNGHHLADALLPVVTAWAEKQARELVAEERELSTLRAYVQDTMGAFGAWCVDRLVAEDPAALAADTTGDPA